MEDFQLAHFPVVWLIDHFGIRIVLGPLGLLSAIATFLIPFAARIGLFIFIAARLIQGIAFAANFSVIGSFITKWTPIKQASYHSYLHLLKNIVFFNEYIFRYISSSIKLAIL